MRYGELLDLIACHNISKGAREARAADDEEMLPDIP